jgi:hypothetical protein
VGELGHTQHREINTKFWSRNVKGRGHGGDLSIHGRIIPKWMFGKENVKVCNSLNWFKIVSNGGPL